MLEKIKEHLDYVGESYFAHMKFALTLVVLCVWAAIALVIHALVPAILQTTGGDAIRRMHRMMAERKEKIDARRSS